MMFKKDRLLTALITVLLLVAINTVAAQSGRWDGADNIPVEPLACPDDSGPDRLPANASYDGGQPARAPDLAGRNIVLVNIPADDRTDYQVLVQEGMFEAATELGNVQFVSNLPTVVDSGDQLNLLRGVASSEVSGVLVNVLDQAAMSSAQRQLLQSGKHVITYEADSSPGAREWFVQPAQPNDVAKTLVDRIVEEAGSSATFVIMTSSYDDPVASRWIAEIWAYAQKCHPGIEWLETVEAQDDEVIAFNLMATLLNQYEDDLNGILSLIPIGTPNAAEAVKRAGLCGNVAVVGLGTPNKMRPYINEGCAGSVTVWDPMDLGYAIVYTIRRAIDQDLRPGSTLLDAGRLGQLQVIGSQILLGSPLVVDGRSINSFNF